MNSPGNHKVSRAELEFLPELRAEIGEAMESATHYMNLAHSFSARGDDAGTAYALRKSVAYFRYGIAAFNQLADLRQRAEATGGA